MITNERQYRIATAELRRFQQALSTHETSNLPADVDPRISEAMRDAMASEAAELQQQLQRYEDLRSGRVTERSLDSLRELPGTLIEARISARLTQADLAERLSVAEQQVQRWEATGYSRVSLDRLQDIADALGVRIHETVRYGTNA